MRTRMINKVCAIFSLMFIFSYVVFAGVSINGVVADLQTQQGIQGATVSIVGTNLSTTSLPDGSFTIQNVPRFSTGFQVKASKTGYVNTYTQIGNIWDSDAFGISFPALSTTIYNMMHTGGGVSHTLGKADIAGMVNGESNSGVVITAKYIDNNTNAGAIRYIGSNNLPSSSLTSTSENGMFLVYNVDPARPIVITGTKPGCIFSSCLVIGYPDSVTVGSIEQVEDFFTISGITIWDDNPVSGVSVSIPGTGISTTSTIDGLFTLQMNPGQYGIMKLSKSGYVDTYQTGSLSEEEYKKNKNNDDEPEDFTILPQNIYNNILSSLGKVHIQGRGDIVGEIETPDGFVMDGVVVSVYDKDGVLVNPDKFYFDEEENPSLELNSTTSASEVLILNLEPGYYYIVCTKNGFEFGRCLVPVFANGITFAPTNISYPPIPGFMKEKWQDIPSKNVPKSAQKVEMLSFILHMMSDPSIGNIILDSVVVTSKGTGNISTSLSSAELYLDSDNNGTYKTKVSTGAISGNKITFSNINTEVGMGLNQKYLVAFNFNGSSASIGKTFGVDILKNADISAHAKNSGLPVTCDGEEPILGNLMTIIEGNPPLKPQNFSPANGTTGVNPSSYTLQSSQFKPGSGNTAHKASEWVLWKDGESIETFTLYRIEDTINLTSIISPTPLEGLTKYWWQVRHQNGDNLWSDWSEPTCFVTSQDGINPPGKPTNQSPENDATNVELPVRLESSQFIPGSHTAHVASQWQVFRGETLIFDTKRDVNNLTSITVSGLSYNTQYLWRVRHQDQFGAWSQWSDFTNFTTKQGMKGDLNGDTQIDISDVILCLRMAISLDPVDIYLGDMNDDNNVDISDVILILRKAIGLE